jgi:hypothetical protein
LAIVVFKQPYEPVHKPVSTRTTKPEPEPEPAGVARCAEPYWEFCLDWEGDELTVSHKGESWGKVFAPNLRGVTLGKQTLPLRALNPNLLEYKVTLARSATSDRYTSVLLQFDLENRSIRHHGETDYFGMPNKYDFAEKERELYRTIDLKICRGEPPARAFCRDPEVEFELQWNDDGLTVRFHGESLRGEAYKADGTPGESELKLDCEGEIIAADSLRAMTLGARALRLESAGPDCFEARLRTSLSAGHGEVDIWVELRIDVGSRSVRYVCYQRFNDCR